MEVVKYLKEFGLGKLVTEFAIKVKEYDEGLIVLNYNQIDSPKSHPIVMECRGLILDKEFNVVSRSFDRFFNYGEQPNTQSHIDMAKAECFEKIDGSLIRIYNWKGVWYVATRGTAFAESEVNGFPTSFKDLVYKALDVGDDAEFQGELNSNLDSSFTYIFEVTSLENRVVRRYDGYNLYYLSARNNTTYEYGTAEQLREACRIGATEVMRFKFDSIKDCVETAVHLKNLDEGYVLYQDGVPVCKIKSPAYVAVHHIRGEGLNPKRISQLVLTGEEEEYLTYFPEDRHFIEPYAKAKKNLERAMELTWTTTHDIEGQKEFALVVKDFPYSAVMFKARKNPETALMDLFNEGTEQSKITLLEKFL